MKKIILTVIGVILILLVLVYLLRPELLLLPLILFSSGAPSPHSDVPIVYSVGWWSHQNDLTVKDLKVEVVESKLGLLNSHSLVRYVISGSLYYKNGKWKPYISKVHLSENILRTLKDSSNVLGNNWIEINLTPIVDVKENSSYQGDTVLFSTRIEEVVESIGWGQNNYIVRCEGITDTLTLHQYK